MFKLGAREKGMARPTAGARRGFAGSATPWAISMR